MFASLFDFTFSRFITTQLARVLDALAMVASLVYAALMGAAISQEVGTILGVIAGIVAFAILLLVARVLIEMTIVLFRIAEQTRDIAATPNRMAESPRETVKV